MLKPLKAYIKKKNNNNLANEFSKIFLVTVSLYMIQITFVKRFDF